MIKIINGDLLLAKEIIIGHQVNCMGVMGSGIAKIIKEKYPSVYINYIDLCNSIDSSKADILLGHAQLVPIDNTRIVANLFGQYKFGRDRQYTNIKALSSAIQQLKDYAKTTNKTVALPYKIGCVRGGANWGEVYNIIDEIFKDYSVTLYNLDLG